MIHSNCTFNSLICALVIVGLSVIATNASAQQEKIDQLLQSAEQGLAAAQSQLGIMYGNGLGVTQDPVEAAEWYRLAAEEGHVFAQYYIGVIYVNGEGVPQDYAEGAKWLRLVAKQGGAIFGQRTVQTWLNVLQR